jgi:hypothetical protein
VLVLVDLAGSAYLAATAPLPAAVPDYALQAATVYRLEIGAACFVAIYLAAIAFFLALDGRGFVEFGTRGLKAEQIVRAADDDEQVTLDEQTKATRGLEAALEDVEASLERAVDEISEQKQRLENVEAQTIS